MFLKSLLFEIFYWETNWARTWQQVHVFKLIVFAFSTWMEQVHMQVVKTNFVNMTAHAPPAHLNRQESAKDKLENQQNAQVYLYF